jgi:hypothetical protein
LKDDLLTKDSEQEVHSRIEAADVFVFVITPSSLSSERCLAELSYAVKHHKTLVPVLRKDVDVLPQNLSEQATIAFRHNDNLDQAFDAFMKAIEADVAIDAFISYSRADEKFAFALHEAFKASREKAG